MWNMYIESFIVNLYLLNAATVSDGDSDLSSLATAANTALIIEWTTTARDMVVVNNKLPQVTCLSLEMASWLLVESLMRVAISNLGFESSCGASDLSFQ